MKQQFILVLIGLLLLNLVNAQNPLTNQRLFDTIPYIMDHHQKRLAQFASEPMTRGGILFLGNSITEEGPWQELIGVQAVNRGISGDITFGVLKRLDEIVERQPEKLFLLIGINDLSMDIPEAIVADNVKKIITRLQRESPGTLIHLQSILPLNPHMDGFLQHFGKQDKVLMCNQLLSKTAGETGVTYINLFPYFLNRELLLRENLTYDGIHLNRQGYEFWVNHLKTKGYL